MASTEDIETRSLLDQTDVIEISDQKLKYIDRAYRKVTSKMYDYNCDIKLVVGTETFKAHRDVLVEASDYFSAMFTHDMRERNDDVIQIHDVSPRGFSSMIEYFYHGFLTVDTSNIEGVVEVARFFHIVWLIQVSRHYLALHLSFEDYALSLSLADQYVIGDLRSAVLSFIGNSFYQLATKPRFLRLQFEALHDLLSGEWFVSASEGSIVHALNKWIEYDVEGREQYRIPLFQLIRYVLLEPEELQLLEESQPQFQNIPELSGLINTAHEQHRIASRCSLAPSRQTSSRGSQPYLVLFSGYDDVISAEYRLLSASSPTDPDYVIREDIDCSHMDGVFEFASVCVVGDCLFVAGGYTRGMLSTPVFYCYVPHRRYWVTLASMNYPRISHTLVSASGISGLFAVAGVNHYIDEIGIDRDKILDTVEYYDPKSNHWTDMPLLPFGVFNAGAVFTHGRLYVTGGISENPEHDVPVPFVHYCRPDDDGWSIVANMNHPRHSHAICSLEDKVYVFGGLTAGDDTMGFVPCTFNEVYDVLTDQWTDLSPIPVDLSGIYLQSSIVIDDQVIILGKQSTTDDYFLYEFNKELQQIETGRLPCGTHIHKIVIFDAAFPSGAIRDFILSAV